MSEAAVLIRCERCRALFELPDDVVTDGVAVQCGRCLLVFKAKRSGEVAPLLVTAPPLEALEPMAEPDAASGKPAPGGRELPAVDMPGDRRPASRTPAPRATSPYAKPHKPVVKAEPEDDYEAMLARKKRNTRVFLLFVGLLVLAGGGYLAATQLKLHKANVDAKKLAEALALVKKDDDLSLEKAVSLYAEVSKAAPDADDVDGDRAYALFLLGGAAKADAEDEGRRITLLQNAMIKLQQEKKDGWEKAFAAAKLELADLDARRQPLLDRSKRLLDEGLQTAREAFDRDNDDDGANRALGFYYSLTGDQDKADASLGRLSGDAATDPRTSYARVAADLTEPSSQEKQVRADEGLSALASSASDFLRAQVDLGRLSEEKGETARARERFQLVLKQNPAHARAKRLEAALPK